MKKVLSILFCTGAFFLMAQIPVIRDGKAACSIILPAIPTAVEKTAAGELAEHLRLISGQNFQVLSEKEMRPDMPYILIGGTALAEKMFHNRLQDDEYVIQVQGNRLLLTGGGTRGTLYAVYDFLERAADCRWLDEHNSIIPAKKELTVKSLNIRRKPDFIQREYSDGFEWWGGIPSSTLFKHRNKGTCAAGKKYGWGGMERLGYASGAHSFHIYMKSLPKNDLACWPMNKTGKREVKLGAFAPAPCMTNPKVQKIFTDTLLQFIQHDREKAKRAGKPYPIIYDLTQNDNPQMCHCPDCGKLIRQYGQKSGLLLYFINKIAEKVETVYPDVYIRTFAYLGTVQPPRGIQPRKNVMIRLAILGKEFSIEGVTADTMSSVYSKSNLEARAVIEDWGKLTSLIDVWDYWGLGNVLAVNVRYIGEKLRYYRKNHAVGMVIDTSNIKHAFFGLRRYLTLKLLDDVSRDDQQLIRDYMTGMFGKAADDMTAYLNYLTEQQEKFGLPLGQYSIHALSYMDLGFFLKCMDYFSRAEKAVGNNAVWQRNIRIEKKALLYSMIQRWDKLGKVPYDKKAMINEYLKIAEEQLNYYFPANVQMSPLFLKKKKNLLVAENNFVFLARAKQGQLPAELAGKKNVRNVPFSFFTINNRRTASRVEDSESNSGLTVMIYEKDKTKRMANSVEFGLYNQTTRKFHSHIKIPLKKFPKDEKYHLFYAGTLELTGTDPGMVTLFAWRSWNFGCTITSLLSAQEKRSKKKIDVYISCRLCGADYIPGSQKENSFSVDAVFLVDH